MYTECEESAFCEGNNASCPQPLAKEDNKVCNEGTKVCKRGKCSGSICLAKGMKECFLTSDRVHDKKKLCEIACQVGNDSATCKSTSELSDIFDGLAVFMRPGAPCNNFQVSVDSSHHPSPYTEVATLVSASTPRKLEYKEIRLHSKV
ncbi:Disintegrin and metalloproteinase domain-containing protein 10 [Chionoecetes opilio]|uniref:Disintegrin and metalloproteinase domain-containing protein 10 n=1 Tax=Chionoecetes opilio TaxID=41210 RepID=A0A8J5D1W3_CHIOP|nr:Disintegrin and metalloproteinase domain-containing protein 10 [Chionoecetes opilio]